VGNSGLVEYIQFKDSSDDPLVTVHRDADDDLDLLGSVENMIEGSPKTTLYFYDDKNIVAEYDQNGENVTLLKYYVHGAT